MSTVCIDVGHGGADPGAVANGLREADLVLEVSKLVAAFLRAWGVGVSLTRTTAEGLSVERRKKLVSNVAWDCVVSIHANSAVSTDANGFEVFHSLKLESSKELGEAIVDSLMMRYAVLKAREPALKTKARIDGSDFYYIIKYPTEVGVPSVLVEIGFLTNEHDAEFYTQFWNIFAIAFSIAQGVYAFLIRG